MAKIAYMAPDFRTLTRCALVVNTDSEGKPTDYSFNKKTDLYVDVNEILAVSKVFDPFKNKYISVCEIVLRSGVSASGNSIGITVTDSYSTIKGYMDRDCNDLCSD